jgi:hypothetical protein
MSEARCSRHQVQDGRRSHDEIAVVLLSLSIVTASVIGMIKNGLSIR